MFGVLTKRSAAVRFRPLTVRQLMWRKFVRHHMAVAAGIVLIVMYVVVLFAGFFAPYDLAKPNYRFIYAPPQGLHFFDDKGAFHLRPFVYPIIGKRDRKTTRFVYSEDRLTRDPLRFFVPGHKYSLFFGLIESDIHFIGVDNGTLFLFGTDLRGRDMLSRIITGGKV